MCVIAGLQEPFPDSQLECIEIRSTPRMQRIVLVHNSMKVQRDVYDPSLTITHSTFILTKSKGLTRTASQSGVERATKQKEPLNMEMAPANQHAIGEMELVPSAVGPNELEQRFGCAKVRTLRR